MCTSFYKMAQEAAISIFYGGIHLQEAIYLGLEQGYQIRESGIAVFDYKCAKNQIRSIFTCYNLDNR